MAKFKAKLKDGRLLIRVKLTYGEVIGNAELEAFARAYIQGFLKPNQIRRNRLEYTGPMGVTLYERLRRPIGKYEFFLIMEQIIDAYQKLQRYNLLPSRAVWNIHQVYYNESTRELQFLYLPFITEQNFGTAAMLMTSIGYSAIPVQEPNADYISRFMFFFSSLKSFDAAKIEKFIECEDRKAFNTIKKHAVGRSGFMTDKPRDYYDHYSERHDDDGSDLTGLLVEEEKTGLLVDEEATGLLDEEATRLLDEEATGLLSDEDGTALLDENQNIHYPTLFRILTEETVTINKPVFRLGKERSYVDYFVTNNNAVSRSHADIITRGQRYFVLDLNSKNRTFINEQVIPVQQEVEIFDGDRLKLANEEFVFYG